MRRASAIGIVVAVSIFAGLIVAAALRSAIATGAAADLSGLNMTSLGRAFASEVENGTDPDALKNILERYPNADFAPSARQRLEYLASIGVRPSFNDCKDCPRLVALPLRSAHNGEGEAGSNLDKKPPGRADEVPIRNGLAIGKFDITRGEFADYVKDTGAATRDTCTILTDSGMWQDESGYSWRNPGFPQTDRDPVVCVSWEDAKAYATWLSRKTGHTYRLPTQAEWEYAARAGSQKAQSWSDVGDACLFGNFNDGVSTDPSLSRGTSPHTYSCPDRYSNTSPIGSFRANWFSLYDTVGNVWQWTEDLNRQNSTTAPVGNGAGPKTHAVQGGSWFERPEDVNFAGREEIASIYGKSNIGFRVIRTQ